MTSTTALLIDPDCAAGKCEACAGDPCQHGCHVRPKCSHTHVIPGTGITLTCDLFAGAESVPLGRHHDPRGVLWNKCDCPNHEAPKDETANERAATAGDLPPAD